MTARALALAIEPEFDSERAALVLATVATPSALQEAASYFRAELFPRQDLVSDRVADVLALALSLVASRHAA